MHRPQPPSRAVSAQGQSAASLAAGSLGRLLKPPALGSLPFLTLFLLPHGTNTQRHILTFVQYVRSSLGKRVENCEHQLGQKANIY